MSKAAQIGSVHAPANGVVVRGIHYPGGHFVPTNELKKAGIRPTAQTSQPDPVKGAAGVGPAKVTYAAGEMDEGASDAQDASVSSAAQPRKRKPTAGVQPSAPQPQEPAAPNYGPHGYRAQLDVMNHATTYNPGGGAPMRDDPQAQAHVEEFQEHLQHPTLGPWINQEYAAGRRFQSPDDLRHYQALVRHGAEDTSIDQKMQSGELRLDNLAAQRQAADERNWRSYKPIVHVVKPEDVGRYENHIYGHGDRPPVQALSLGRLSKDRTPIQPRIGRHIYYVRPDGTPIGFGRIQASEDAGDHWTAEAAMTAHPTHHTDDFGQAYAAGWQDAFGGNVGAANAPKKPTGEWASVYWQLGRGDANHRRPYGHSAPGAVAPDHEETREHSALWRAYAEQSTPAGSALTSLVNNQMRHNGHGILQSMTEHQHPLNNTLPTPHRSIPAESAQEEARERWEQHLKTDRHAGHDDLERILGQVVDEMYPKGVEPDAALDKVIADRRPYFDHMRPQHGPLYAHQRLRDFIQTPQGQKSLAAMPAILRDQRWHMHNNLRQDLRATKQWHTALSYKLGESTPEAVALKNWLRAFPNYPHLHAAHPSIGPPLIDYLMQAHEKAHAHPQKPV